MVQKGGQGRHRYTACLLGGLEMLIKPGTNADAHVALAGKEFWHPAIIKSRRFRTATFRHAGWRNPPHRLQRAGGVVWGITFRG